MIRSYFRRFFYLLACVIVLQSCSDEKSSNPVTNEPKTGRGAVISSVLKNSVSSAQITADLKEISSFLSAQNPVEIYRIIYETIDEHGAKVKASGTIILPQNLTKSVPIVSYQHGTVVQKISVAYYNGYKKGGFESVVGIGFGGNGYITVLPDYLGLGEGDGLHPYVHAKSLATSVADMLKAAAAFSKSKGVEWNKQIFLTGYSEGGYATMAAHKYMEEFPDADMTITASAPMAGPYDMSGSMKDLMLSGDPYPYPLYLPYTVYSYNRAYNIFPSLEDVFKKEYADIIPEYFNGSYIYGFVNNQFPEVPREMFSEEFLKTFANNPDNPLTNALRENDLYNWTPKAPVKMYHCTGDEQVPYANSTVALNGFKSRGAQNVELVTPGDYMHNDCATYALMSAKLWFDTLKK